jgi:hypothetical protein
VKLPQARHSITSRSTNPAAYVGIRVSFATDRASEEIGPFLGISLKADMPYYRRQLFANAAIAASRVA